MKAPSSRNIGINISQGKYIFILDDDIEIQSENLISKSINILEEDKNIGAIFPKKIDHYFKNGKEVFNEYSCSKKTFYSGDLRIKKCNEGIVDYPCMCYITRKNILEQINSYDPIYGLNIGHSYREESDIHEKIKKNGYLLYYDPTICIQHNILNYGGQDQRMSNKIYWIAHNHLVYLKKHDKLYNIRKIGWLIDLIGFSLLRGFPNLKPALQGYLLGIKTSKKLKYYEYKT